MDYQKVGQGNRNSQGGCGLATLIFLIFAAFVETDKVCFSNGTDWQTTPVEGYTNVSSNFTHMLWGLTITSALSAIIPIAGTIHIGYFIWMAIAIFSEAGKLCTEHVLSARGTFMLIYFWLNIALTACVCLAVCALVALKGR